MSPPCGRRWTAPGIPLCCSSIRVSALASIDFRMDEWGVSVCISGSQKGLDAARRAGCDLREPEGAGGVKEATSRRCYFDYGDMARANAFGYFPIHSGAAHALWLARVADNDEEEGLDNYYRRHAFLAVGTRAAVLEGWD